MAPSSPSPSDRSLPPFSSGSSISETTSTGSASSSMVAPPNGVGLNQHQQINQSSLQKKNNHSTSLLQQSLHHNNSLVIPEDEQLDSASALAVSIANGKFLISNLPQIIASEIRVKYCNKICTLIIDSC